MPSEGSVERSESPEFTPARRVLSPLLLCFVLELEPFVPRVEEFGQKRQHRLD
jgi:hypothetical protein